MTGVAGFFNQMYINTKIRFSNFINDERGDTNFISIAIILIVIIAVAIVFITFGQDIKKAFETKINELKTALGI